VALHAVASIDTTTEKLAIDGGVPALSAGPPPWPPVDDDIRLALDAAWADGSWGRYHGPHTERLASLLAARHDVAHVTLCCSGTMGVELALRGLAIGPGDEVLLGGYDFPGNFRAIEATGARPALIDVGANSCLVDVERIAASARPEMRAIVVSHLHGMLVDMPRVMEIARRHHLAVVEDACQVPGATIAGRAAGSWGDVGVLSFGGSKLLSAGRGGALLMSDAQMQQRIKVFSHRGNQAFPLSELQAAVLMPQLARLDERNRRRAAAVERLLGQTTEIASLAPMTNRTENSNPVYYKLAWRYEPPAAAGAPIDEFLAALRAEGAPVDGGFRGFSGRSERRCRKAGTLEHSRRAAESTILLHHPLLLAEPEQIDALAHGMTKVARAFGHRIRH
jgi:dTDP-4-amino-4,6-dideoxygalactose transaminase